MGRLKEAVLNGRYPVRRSPSMLIEPRTEQQDCRTEADLIALARRRGYRNPEWWAKKVLDGRRNKA